MTGTKNFKITLIAAAVIAGQTPLSHAQESESVDSLALEEIIVTATKRAKSLQDVPVAITAYSGDDLSARGVFQVRDLQELSPSLTINTTTNSSQAIVRIRGIGSSGTNPGFESAVGVVIDGVVRSRAGQALGDMLDIERIEILRGPQGTLFGKNTSAGALSLISRSPEYETNGSVNISVGDYNQRRQQFVFNTALIEDELAFRISGSNHERDGFLDKLSPGTSGEVEESDYFNDRDRYAGKAQLLWEPNHDFSARMIVDYSTLDEIGSNGVPMITAPVWQSIYTSLGAYVQPDNNLDDRRVQTTTDPFEKTTAKGISTELNWDLGWAELTSITAYRDFETTRSFDLDQGGTDMLRPLIEDNTIKSVSQEIRLAGISGDVEWLVGGYAFRDEIALDSGVFFGTHGNDVFAALLGAPVAAVPEIDGQGITQTLKQESSGYALFTHNTWHATDNLDIVMGLRVSTETKEATSILNDAPIGQFLNDVPLCALSNIGPLCNNISFSRKREDTEVSGTFKLNYTFDNGVSIYGGYSRGYKAGGFNLDRQAVEIDPVTLEITDGTEFDGEFADSLEFGLKSSLWDGRANLNVALFYSVYEGFQLNAFDGLSYTVLNLEDVISHGAEVETTVLLAEGITWSSGITYNHARYGDDIGNEEQAFREGAELPQSPFWQASTSLSIDREIDAIGARGIFNLNHSFRDSAYNATDRNPEQEVAAYSLFSASIGLRSLDDRYGLVLSVDNLTDEVVPTNVTPTINQPGSYYGYLNDPRTWTLAFDAKF
ncbi:TonB-dependent receptor [Pseudomaricurvus alkylphenolicus]|uniref:TonB-dependent receptor n=1 Tax=Pseudomaricurvus alkylphenolicus TaxID=1306991 RepID=UPI001421AD52|nr:TonB-dependent receptor [Pseudomaricurvus alkylphenolicus]NIB45197.1 TonB-dependent receptor [Pseudomaricurvus alkylphenolicus]